MTARSQHWVPAGTSGPAPSNWTNDAGLGPDGTADATERITHNGVVVVGTPPVTAPPVGERLSVGNTTPSASAEIALRTADSGLSSTDGATLRLGSGASPSVTLLNKETNGSVVLQAGGAPFPQLEVLPVGDLKLANYTESRNDTTPINNFLATDATGVLRSHPISELFQGTSTVLTTFARATITIGDPTPAGALPVATGSVNTASAVGIGGAAVVSQVTVNFATPAPNTDYQPIISFRSQAAAAFVNDTTVLEVVSSKTVNGFTFAVRETTNVAQALFVDVLVLAAGNVSGQLLTAGSNVVITPAGQINMTPSLISGNIIAIGEKRTTLQQVQFENLAVRWNSATDVIQMATLSGTASAEVTTRINFGTQGAVINGGAGVDGSVQGTNLALSTTFATLGDPGITGIEDRTYNVWLATGQHYRINVVRKGTTATDGWCTFVVEKIGVTSGLAPFTTATVALFAKSVVQTLNTGTAVSFPTQQFIRGSKVSILAGNATFAVQEGTWRIAFNANYAAITSVADYALFRGTAANGNGGTQASVATTLFPVSSPANEASTGWFECFVTVPTGVTENFAVRCVGGGQTLGGGSSNRNPTLSFTEL